MSTIVVKNWFFTFLVFLCALHSISTPCSLQSDFHILHASQFPLTYSFLFFFFTFLPVFNSIFVHVPPGKMLDLIQFLGGFLFMFPEIFGFSRVIAHQNISRSQSKMWTHTGKINTRWPMPLYFFIYLWKQLLLLLCSAAVHDPSHILESWLKKTLFSNYLKWF